MSAFSGWVGEIDTICWREFSLSVHDQPDLPFRDAFDDNLTPEEFFAEEIGDELGLARIIVS